PGADHGHSGRTGDADRTDSGRGLFHAARAPAVVHYRGMGTVLRAYLHRFRPIRSGGHLGIGAPRVPAKRTERPGRAMSEVLLQLDGLTKRYGALVAVDNVSMRVQEGEVRAVIGPNGAGKTTLFHLITGVVAASSGTVRFRGSELTRLAPHAICQRGLSRTFQLTSLFPRMSARDSPMLAARARHPRRWVPFGGGAVFARARAAGERALEQLGLAHLADRPAGLLSHGDQRLLEVAMAMAQEPRVLLLDEPTQGLSVEETAQAVETLAGLLDKARVTVLLVEHDMEVVFRLAHRITVLHRGAVI